MVDPVSALEFSNYNLKIVTWLIKSLINTGINGYLREKKIETQISNYWAASITLKQTAKKVYLSISNSETVVSRNIGG